MAESNYYIATSIPYVNDVPHLGHAMEYTLADILARYEKSRGKDVFFSVGTDEHGGKVMEKAHSLGISPDRYTDQISESFKDLCRILAVDYTKFVRTSSPEHKAIVSKIWQNLQKDIYKGSYSGMYDQKEETFLTDEEAKEISKSDPVRFARLQKLEEDNYFFRLSDYTEKVKTALNSGQLEVVPATKKNEVLALLDKGLNDLSISRPKEKIPWGINVPGDETQTIYVWFEALMNYITTLRYDDGPDFLKFWPASTQVIGKDITRFHAAIWPAILMSLGLELPKRLYVHGFININGAKMSKSDGNVVSPTEVVSVYGADALRYYFARHIPSIGDGDFTWEKFERAYNSELGNDLGNLVQRTASMINKYQGGVIGPLPDSVHDTGPYHQKLAEFRFDQALSYVWELIRGLNQYIEDEKPWQIAKKQDDEHLQVVLAYIVSSLVQVADLLHPFMPQTAASIKAIFFDGLVRNYEGTLFPKVNKYT